MISAASDRGRDQDARSYAAWLDQRNGRIGSDGRTLERRERAMARAESATWPAASPVERREYEHWLSRRRPPATLSRATLWALCLAKASAAESFGASVGTNFATASDPAVAHVLAHIEAEEAYHARVARCLLAALGLHRAPPPPDRLTRLLVRAMAGAPERWGGAIVVYSGEVTAAALFRSLREELPSVFAEPEARAIARGLLDDVIVDEEAHARFARTRLSSVDAALCRRLMPHVVRVLEQTLPEASHLFGSALDREVRAVAREVG